MRKSLLRILMLTGMMQVFHTANAQENTIQHTINEDIKTKMGGVKLDPRIGI